MRICFIQSQGHMYSGGQGVYLHYVTRELARMGHDVHVIAGVPYPDVAEGVHLHKLKTFGFWSMVDRPDIFAYGTHPMEYFHPVNFTELISTRFTLSSLLLMFSLRAYERLNELEAEAPFDLVHDNQTLAYGVWLMRGAKRPVVATVHHPLSVDRDHSLSQAPTLPGRIRKILWYPWVMQEWVARRVDAIVTVSEAAATSVRNAFDVEPERVHVVPNGIDGSIFRPLELHREPRRILFVGRTDDRNKGFWHLLQALRKLRTEESLKLVVVHRPGSHETHRLVQRMGFFGQIEFLENITTDELVEEYNRAQFVVVPSLYEGFGLPAAEALACGTPVIATPVGAMTDIVEDGVSGVLVPPGDSAALLNTIRLLLPERGRCLEMGQRGRKHVLRHYSWERSARKLEGLYQDLCDAAAGKGGT